MTMIMDWLKPTECEGFPALSPVKYRVLIPEMMIIRNEQEYGNMLYGFGIGDIIEVMEPRVQSLACRHGVYKEIPLKDGTAIVAYDSQMKFERVYPQIPYRNTLIT